MWRGITGKRLTQSALKEVFDRLEEATKDAIPGGVHAHRFRHTAITQLLRQRVPLRSVQRYAGHTNPQTTLRYAQAIEADEALQAVESASPALLLGAGAI